MKKLKLVIAIMFLAISINTVIAEELTENEKEEVVWLRGSVTAIKDNTGKITAATFKTVDIDENDNEIKVTYQIVLNKKGMEVIQKFNGKEVELAVFVFKKGKVNFIKISEYEELDNNNEADEE